MAVKNPLQVRHLLSRKGQQVYFTRPESTVYEALQMMAELDIGALVVMHAGRLVGIFSERDYARKVILHGKSSHDTLVEEIMTPRVYYVTPDHTVEECMALMTEKHFRHLPVLEGDTVMGLISIGDVVKCMIDEQGFLLEQMENYITGTR
jgi:CBS domain-containing protein